MKTRSIILITLLLLCGIFSLQAQGLKAPSKGKAAIYFVRPTSFGAMIGFKYFHQDKFFAKVAGKNYLRYEVDPGKHLLWASSENKEFMTAEVEAGKTYMVLVDVIMGFGSARVGFRPLDINTQKEEFDKCMKVVKKKKPVVTSDEKIKEENEELKEFIAEKLNDYETIWKKEKNFKHLAPGMAIPSEFIK